MFEIVPDKNFNIEQTHYYILSIQLRLDGFSFYVLEPETKTLLAYGHTPVKISDDSLLARRCAEWFAGNELFSKPFNKINVVFFSQMFTLYPLEYDAPNMKTKIRDHLFPSSKTGNMAENILQGEKAKILFMLPPGLYECLNQTLGHYELNHPVKSLLAHVAKGESKANRVVFHIQGQLLFLFAFSETGLELTNAYKVEHSNDTVYFIMNTIKQLGFSDKPLTLEYLGGTLPEELSMLLERFFPQGISIKTHSDYLIPEELSEKKPSIINHSLFF